ncbi:MAG: DUF692 family protein [Anaerolineae bacterium]|nr:DUF692 family protein [Anaerolineae bacterium]
MIQLGMTDCSAVRTLMDRKKINLDYLEVHGPYVEEARGVYPRLPMLLHNILYNWSLVHPGGLHHQRAAALTMPRLQQTRSPWLSLHLGFSAEEVDFHDEAIYALTPTLPPEVIFERTSRALVKLLDVINVPLLIENMDYNPTGAYETICQPEFITRMLLICDSWLLLDIAHARVSAEAFNVPVKDYLSQIPLDRVRQIHINHPGLRDGRRVDSHEALQEEDYELLQWVLQFCSPWALTLEYNRDEEQIPPQLERLRRILA